MNLYRLNICAHVNQLAQSNLISKIKIKSIRKCVRSWPIGSLRLLYQFEKYRGVTNQSHSSSLWCVSSSNQMYHSDVWPPYKLMIFVLATRTLSTYRRNTLSRCSIDWFLPDEKSKFQKRWISNARSHGSSAIEQVLCKSFIVENMNFINESIPI